MSFFLHSGIGSDKKKPDSAAYASLATLVTLPHHWRWPPCKSQSDRKNQERALREALKRHLRQLNDLCRAVKAESIADLQEILCSMILSECVYKVDYICFCYAPSLPCLLMFFKRFCTAGVCITSMSKGFREWKEIHNICSQR